MSDAGDISFGIKAEGEEAAASDVADAFEKAFRSAAKSMGKAFATELGKTMSGSKSQQWAKNAKKLTQDATKGIKDFEDVVTRVGKRLDEIVRDMGRIRIPEGEFRAAATQAERLSDKLEEVDRAQEAIARDVSLRKLTEEQLRTSARLTDQLALNFRALTDVRKTEFAKQREQARVDLQSETRLVEAATKERIVLAQQEGAQALAATRSSTQRRLAVFRAFVGQVRALERGLGAVFRTTARAAGAGISGIAASISGLASRLRRSNREMTAGLSGALGERESRLFSSFRRQETIVSSSIARQSRTLNRFETAASTGVAGVVSGRSQLGALLGGGLAIGGGFALISKFRELATASADFEQGLAVLDAQLNLTDRQMARIRQTSIDLGNDITLPGVSALDAAQAIQNLTKQFGTLGADAPQAAVDAAKGVLQLSRAAGVGADEAGRLVGAAINVFDIEADQAVAVADQFAGALSVAAGVGFGEFAQSFNQAAAVFDQFQGPALGAEQTLLEFNTALAVMAKNATIGSDAGTSLKQFFLQASRNAAPAKKALAEVADRAGVVGSVFFDQAGAARPLTEALGILRKGLEGMSDEQRNATLQTIFGSDAVRTANALLKVSSEEYEKIRRKIQQQGLAAKIAAAQNTGLRGALDAANSVLETQAILIGEKLNVALGNAVLKIVDFANKLLSAGGAFAVARSAIKGVAVALAGLLAFKAAGEALRFFLIMLRGILTPFGLLVTAVTIVGAVLGIMMDRSEALREAVGRLREAIGDRLGEAVEFVKEQLGNLGDFIANTVLPALEKVITFIVENWDTAWNAVATFFRETVIPALKNFADFITGTVWPAIRNFLVRGFEIAREAISNFWDVAQPIIEPAIEGFRRLGEAIAGIEINSGLLAVGGILASAAAGFAVAGPLGAAIGGLGASVASVFALGLQDELVGALSGLGETVVGALSPVVERVVGFLKGFFTLDRLLDITGSFLDLVEEIGRIIGSIVTDPRFVGAIAGIVAFAATVVFRFTEGLARGIASNIPEWGRLFLEGLKQGLSFAIRGLGDALSSGEGILAVGAVISALFLGAAAISRWKAAGAAAAQATGQGFLGTFRRFAFGGLFAPGAGGALGSGPRSFATALFGDQNAIAGALTSRMQSATRAAQRETAAMQRVLATAGIRISNDFTRGFSTEQIKSRFAQLTQELGPAGALGLGLRSAFQASVSALLTRSLTPFRQLRQEFSVLGLSLGKTLASGIAGALGGAFAGIQVGQSLQGASGWQQILGIGGLALALGAVNPLLGVTAGLAGALTIALGDTSDASENFTQRINDMASALRDAESPFEALADRLFTDLAAEAPETQEALGDLGFKMEDLVDKVRQLGTDAPQGVAGMQAFLDILRGNGAVLDQNIGAFEAGAISLDKLLDVAGGSFKLQQLGISADDLRNALTFLMDAGIVASDGLELADIQAGILGQTVTDTGDAVSSASELFSHAFGQQRNEIQPQLEDVREAARLSGEAATTAAQKFADFLTRDYRDTLQGQIDELTVELGGIGEAVTGANLEEGVTAAVAAANIRLATQDFRITLGEIIAEPSEVGIDLEGTRGDINRVQADVQAALDTALAEGEITAEAHATLTATVTEFFDRPGLLKRVRRLLRTAAQAAEDEAAAAAATTIEVPVNPSLTVPEDFDPKQDLLSAILGGGQLGPGGPKGGGGGSARFLPAVDPIEVPIPIAPVVEVSAATGANAAEIGQNIAKIVAIGLVTASGVIATALGNSIALALRGGAAAVGAFAAAGAAVAQALARGIQSQAGSTAAAGQAIGTTAVVGAVSTTGAMIASGVTVGAGFAAGVGSQAGAAAGAGSSLGSSAAGGASGYSLYSTGVNVGSSFVSGVLAMVSSAYNAGRALGNAATQGARDALQVASPSRVFRNIGREVGEGLALGLADSETTIESAVSEAIDNALETARSRVPNRGAARAGVAAGIFDLLLPGRLPGGPSNIDIDRSLSDVKDAVVGIGETFRNVVQDLRDDAAQRITDLREELVAELAKINTRLEEARSRAFERVFGSGADIRRQRFDLGGIADQFKRAVREAGEPASGDKKAVPATAAERRDIFLQFGEQIRQLGSTLFESGAKAKAVRREVTRYRDALVEQARRQGMSNKEINNLLKVLGLTDKQLNNFVNSIRRAGETAAEARERIRRQTRNQIDRVHEDLEEAVNRRTTIAQGTPAGRQNRRAFQDAFESVREFGSRLLAAGTPVRQVVERMKQMREGIIKTAKDLGFNGRQIRELAQMLGLSNEQLREFAEQVHRANEELENPPAPPTPPPGLVIGPGGTLPSGFRDLHIHVPYGDPEAIGLAVQNRTSFEQPIPA